MTDASAGPGQQQGAARLVDVLGRHDVMLERFQQK
jgi:hypothetical protein